MSVDSDVGWCRGVFIKHVAAVEDLNTAALQEDLCGEPKLLCVAFIILLSMKQLLSDVKTIFQWNRINLHSLESPFSSLYITRKTGKRCSLLLKQGKNRVCSVLSSFKVNIWSELLYSPAQPEPSETSFLSFL